SASDDIDPPHSGFAAKRLSVDHTADDPSEQERVKESGGFITRGRVLGILAVTRSFGDHGMKDFVTATPHLSEVDLSDSSSQPYPFLILACDGVWDVMSDQEAVDLLMESFVAKGGPFDGAAELLVSEAIDRGTSDNVSAVVVFL
ncbi:PTC1, partial [Symbiodinium microadriaticum]